MPKPKKGQAPLGPPGETPFQKFERLAKAIVSVPKEMVTEGQQESP